MMKLHYYKNPILRKRAEPVDEINDEIKKLIDDMVVFMDENNGQGLAAPQIGQLLRLFVVRFYEKGEDGEYKLSEVPEVFINPKILSYSEKKVVMEEGCISLPEIAAPVRRPESIKVSYTNEKNEKIETELHGLHARVFLHENDHLNGVIYVDRVDKKTRPYLEPYLERIKKEYN